MRVSNAAANGATITSFFSAKTNAAIPVRCSLLNDALVQATLDPEVLSIEFLTHERVATSVTFNAIVIVRDEGRFVLDVAENPLARDLERESPASSICEQLGLSQIILTAADIMQEPRHANCNLVWSYRTLPVGISMRMGILQCLADDGPMSFGRLLSALRGDRDPSPAVLALACSDLVELDLLSGPLGPETITRIRREK
jgi:hypothetical protein